MNSATTTMVVLDESCPDGRLCSVARVPLFGLSLLVARRLRAADTAVTRGFGIAPEHARRTPREIRTDGRRLDLHHGVHLAVLLVLARAQLAPHDHRIADPQRGDDPIREVAPADHAHEQWRAVAPRLLITVEPPLPAGEPKARLEPAVVEG